MKKILSALIAIVFVFSFVPSALFAQGSSIDDPYFVSDLTALRTALSGDDYTFIAIDNQISGYGETEALVIPEGKTLIIDDSDLFPYLLMDFSIIIENDASLIIRSGVSLGQGHTINSNGGTIINSGLIVNSTISLYSDSCTLINESTGLINDRNAILFDSGATIINNGQIDCYLYCDGSAPAIEGVSTDRIGTILSPPDIPEIPDIDATGDVTFPIFIEDSIGLPDDGSFVDETLSTRNAPRFVRMYSITLEDGQTLSLQRSGNFSPAMYIAEGHPEGNMANIRFVGDRFTAEAPINGNDNSEIKYFVFVAGYNAYDTGHFTLSIHQPEQTEQLSFWDPASPVSGPGWSWDEATKTLTLDGFTFSGDPSSIDAAILLPEDSQIVLAEGSENYIRTNGIAIQSTVGDFSISGRGSLTINAGSVGIFVSGSHNDLYIDNLTSLHIDAEDFAIMSYGDIFIENCDEIIANAGINSNSAGIRTIGGGISIIRSDLWVTGNRHGIVSDTSTPGASFIYIEESYIDATTVEQYGRGPITVEGDGDIELVQSMLIYPEEAKLLNQYNWEGDQLGQTFIIYERPGDPDVIHDMQYAVRSLQISPAYTLEYDANGGSGIIGGIADLYYRGQSVTLTEDVYSREGFVFTGWNTADDGSGDDYASGDTLAVYSNTTLFAQWRAEYTVQFIDWNDNIISEQIVLSGDSATAPTPPEREGYTFVDWNQSFESVSGDMVIAGVYRLDIIEEDPETEPPEQPSDETEDSDQTDTETDADSETPVPRTGQTNRSIYIAMGLIISGGALITSYLLIKKKISAKKQ